jgi:hypothetical protein
MSNRARRQTDPVSAEKNTEPAGGETMFEMKSESGENRSQSAGETLQPLPNTRAATQESATGSDPETQRIGSDEARQFLQVLGKDPAAAWFRSIRPGKGANKRRKGADLHGFNPDELAADSAAGDSLYVVIGNADTCTGTAIRDADITSLPALFAEWDTGTAAEQQQALDASGLPDPSMLVHTGGKSLHAYWLLDEPISPEQWKLATRRLIAHTGADPQCSNPSRVMRLPGSTYYDKKTGKPTGTASIISAPGTRYALAALVEVLPDIDKKKTTTKSKPVPAPRADFAPRSLDDIQAAAQYIPERVVGGNTYETCRRALCGCAAALDEIGLPEQQALDLLAAKWPSTEDAQQALNSSTTRNPAAFWAIAKEHGFNTRRPQLRVVEGGRSTAPQAGATNGGKRIRLAPDDVLTQLPQILGTLRQNIRTGDVMTDAGILTGNQIGRLYLQLSNSGETWPKEATADAVMYLAGQDTYDPVAEYLDGITAAPLPMDQWQHLDQHLLGITDPIAARFLPRFLISAVARTMEPGCYVRQSPVLVGPQERGKSELGRILFGADHWVEGVGKLDRDALQRAHTAWGVELAELDGVTRRRDQEQLKAFLTETCDTYQIRYDRHPEAHKRRFVFWGSANRPPLRDSTGSTRFVIIPVPDQMLPLDWARQNRDALWARALQQYRSGVTWLRTDEQERQEVEARNADFIERDPWADRVAALLSNRIESDTLPVKVPEILQHLGLPVERQTNEAAKRVSSIAELNGWRHGRRTVKGQKLQGLWPGHPGHPGHPEDTPRGVRGNASPDSGSQPTDTPDTPISVKGEIEVEKGNREHPGTELEMHAGGSGPFSGCPGCPPDQTDCSARPDGVSGGVSAGVSGGVSEGCPPAWLPQLLAIRAANPTAHPSSIRHLLYGLHGIAVTVAQINAALKHLAESD